MLSDRRSPDLPQIDRAPTRRKLAIHEQRVLDLVIDAARRTPGALRVLNHFDMIFTAQCHQDRFGERTRWRIETLRRELVTTGEC